MAFSVLSLVNAQDIVPPDKPEITYVTVDTANNNTIIYWAESEADDVLWYYLYFEVETVNGMEGVILDSIAPGTNVYIHTGNAGEEALTYSISAIDNSGNESLRTPGFHKTIHTTIFYDSCFNAVNLNWNTYTGWGNNISGYRIFYRTLGDSYNTPPFGVGRNDSTFRIENIGPNRTYFFYVEAVKNDTLVSRSNLIRKFTYMPGPPDNFQLVNVNTLDPGSVEINFSYEDTSGIDDFRLLRSVSRDADFINIKSQFDLSQGMNSFIDEISTANQRYYYKIGALNSCVDVFHETNPGTNIVLSGFNEGNQNELQWTEYEEWATEVEVYELYRVDSDGNEVLIHTSNSFNRTWSDLISATYGTDIEGSISYFVQAKKQSEEIYSRSNLLTLNIQSEMAVPNAFTPNGDGNNDVFLPVFTMLPREFKMIIYDRYGIIQFESSDPLTGWEGTTSNGDPAIEGVYVYHIQYISHTGTAREKTGQLTVFYP